MELKGKGNTTGKTRSRRSAALDGESVPDVINPDKTIDLKDLPSMFKTIHRMLTSLKDLNCEYRLKLPDGTEFWLVPSYSEDRLARKEVSFRDAATLTVVCAAFGGVVESMHFKDSLPDTGYSKVKTTTPDKMVKETDEGVELEEDVEDADFRTE